MFCKSVEVDAREDNIGDRNAEREDNIRQRAEAGTREDRHSRVHQVGWMSFVFLFVDNFYNLS